MKQLMVFQELGKRKVKAFCFDVEVSCGGRACETIRNLMDLCV